MYYSGYNRLFWGIIFVIFNFNIGPVNIFPDFIGYIIIFSGLNLISEQNPNYETGKMPACILIFLSLKGLFNLENIAAQSQLTDWKFGFMVAGSIESIISIYLIYCICKGIYEVANERGIVELRDEALKTFKYYFIFSVLFLFYTPFSINLSQNMNSFMILPMIINIFVLIFLAVLFRRGREQLSENDAE